MSSKKWKKIGILAAKQAREEAHAAGVAFSYMIQDKVIREYPDGKKVEVTFDEQGNPTEIDYTG
ncbi:hypothetical protein [Paenibacillus shenyangensis]|uniref:hypothetical protein n=1 Tax=Paenibacillus sp. A9 TaxID=1284352 RepID=UPI001EE6CC49|nr:hypothetical protein [Paenibacillus sp. A9]